MKRITIAYSNIWEMPLPADYLLAMFPCLRGHYEFEASEQPQLSVYSVYDDPKNIYKESVRVIYSGEYGSRFDQSFFHFGITCNREETSPNHCYMPQGLLHLNLYHEGVVTLLRPTYYLPPPLPREFFCDFIYSHGQVPIDRAALYRKLSIYKEVQSCGDVERSNNALAEYLPTAKARYLQKQAFQSRCKFSLAIENTHFPGYNTEKITDPFVAGSVPIYRGDPLIAKTYNPEAFINLDDFNSDEDAIEYIKTVDSDDGLYSAYLNAPPFPNNRVPTKFSDAYYLEFWKKILDPL